MHQDPAARLSHGLLLLSATSGLFSVGATLFSDWPTSARCGVVALAALVGYLIVAGRSAPPRTRWTLAAGIGLFAVVLVLRLWWHRERVGADGWFAYAPLGEAHPAAAEPWQRMIDRERIAAIGYLLGVLCLAVTVRALPPVRQPKRAALTIVLAVLLLAVAGVAIGSRIDEGSVRGLLGTTWPVLLATLVAVGMTALAGRRARTWRVPAGTLLVAVVTAIALDNLVGLWSAWSTLFGVHDGLVMSTAMSVSLVDSPDVFAAVETAVALGGPMLLASGALHACRAAHSAESSGHG